MTTALPAEVPAPEFLGCYDDGEWGRHPATPWAADELDRVLTVLEELASSLTPPPLPDVETAAEFRAEEFGGWHRIAADPPADLHPWAAGHLDELCALAERGLAALSGDTLVHTDTRADNILLRPQGGVTIVERPAHRTRVPARTGSGCPRASGATVDAGLMDATRPRLIQQFGVGLQRHTDRLADRVVSDYS